MVSTFKDSPLHRIVITEMTEEQIDAHLEGIRERRLRPIRVYKEAEELKMKVLQGKLTAKLDKQLSMFNKDLDAANKHTAKLEKRATLIKAILLELEDVTTIIDGEGDTPDEERGNSGEAPGVDAQGSDLHPPAPEHGGETDTTGTDGTVRDVRSVDQSDPGSDAGS